MMGAKRKTEGGGIRATEGGYRSCLPCCLIISDVNDIVNGAETLIGGQIWDGYVAFAICGGIILYQTINLSCLTRTDLLVLPVNAGAPFLSEVWAQVDFATLNQWRIRIYGWDGTDEIDLWVGGGGFDESDPTTDPYAYISGSNPDVGTMTVAAPTSCYVCWYRWDKAWQCSQILDWVNTATPGENPDTNITCEPYDAHPNGQHVVTNNEDGTATDVVYIMGINCKKCPDDGVGTDCTDIPDDPGGPGDDVTGTLYSRYCLALNCCPDGTLTLKLMGFINVSASGGSNTITVPAGPLGGPGIVYGICYTGGGSECDGGFSIAEGADGDIRVGTSLSANLYTDASIVTETCQCITVSFGDDGNVAAVIDPGTATGCDPSAIVTFAVVQCVPPT